MSNWLAHTCTILEPVVVGPYKALDKLKDSDQVRIMDVEADPKAGRDQTDDVQPDANSESLSLTAGSS